MATITGNMVINDVIKKHPQTIKVFNDYKVDSCCGGGGRSRRRRNWTVSTSRGCSRR